MPAPGHCQRSLAPAAPASNRPPLLSGRSSGRDRRIRPSLILFALALTLAFGAVLLLIGAGAAQAEHGTAVINAKSDGWVGLAAGASVLVSALVGAALVHRHLASRRR